MNFNRESALGWFVASQIVFLGLHIIYNSTMIDFLANQIFSIGGAIWWGWIIGKHKK